ncbi:MAG: HEAT repeat domain-containing protein [Candidatus Zixiibacteriota bacterium]
MKKCKNLIITVIGIITTICICMNLGSCGLGRQTCDQLMNKLNKADGDKKISIIQELAERRCNGTIETLIGALEDKDYGVSRAAIEALVTISSETEEYLLANMERLKRRSDLLRLLGQVGSRKGAKALMSLCLNTTREDIKGEILHALGVIGDPVAADIVISEMNRGNAGNGLRYTSIVALTKMGRPALGRIKYALDDYDPYVRLGAFEALLVIGDKPIFKSIFSEHEDVDISIVLALGAIESGSAIDTSHQRVQKRISSQDRKLMDSLTGDVMQKLDELQRRSHTDIDSIILHNKLMVDLRTWNESSNAVLELERIGWYPKSAEDSAHFFAAKRQWSTLRNSNLASTILLSQLRHAERGDCEAAVFSLIAIGEEHSIEGLIVALAEKGNRRMAEAFLNCGNERLRDVSKCWAALHGYDVTDSTGSQLVIWRDTER